MALPTSQESAIIGHRFQGMNSKFSESDAWQSATSAELLVRARRGDSRAISTLFRRHGGALRRWARGRLPKWARSINDTADIVQDALLQTFRRVDRFDNRGKGALSAYLRQAVVNRIRDEMRRVARRPAEVVDERILDMPAHGKNQFDLVLDAEQEQRYKEALKMLSEEDRLLIVGRIELHYNYHQLALITGRATPDAARLAVRRAALRLAKSMSSG